MLRRSSQNAPQRQKVVDAKCNRIVMSRDPICLPEIHPGDSVARSRVVKPLPIQIQRGDDPLSNDPDGPERDDGDKNWKHEYQKPSLREALGVESESRVGCHHMLIPEQPNV